MDNSHLENESEESESEHEELLGIASPNYLAPTFFFMGVQSECDKKFIPK